MRPSSTALRKAAFASVISGTTHAAENAAAFRAGHERKIARDRVADTVEAMRWVLHVTPFRHESDTTYLRKGSRRPASAKRKRRPP
jgi:hypothetical protein